MILVHPSLYVGSQADYEQHVEPEIEGGGWAVVHACKVPHHVGIMREQGHYAYAAPKDSPEYLFATRPNNRLILNMVDSPGPPPEKLVDRAVEFIRLNIIHRDVLIHCNEGQSRAPSLALLYLHCTQPDWEPLDLEAAEKKFRAIYPGYAPKSGMRSYLETHWAAPAEAAA